MKKSRTPGRTLLLAGGGAVALILLVAVVLAGGSGSGDDHPDLQASPSVTGQLPAFVGGSSDPAIGMAAPEASGVDFAGNQTAIVDNGKAKAIVFLAHWCGHCRAEVPEIQRWLDANSLPTDVELIGVATAMDPLRENFPTSEWLEDEGWTAPLIVDDAASSIYTAYGAQPFPGWVIVGADGNVLARLSGAGAFDLDQLPVLATLG